MQSYSTCRLLFILESDMIPIEQRLENTSGGIKLARLYLGVARRNITPEIGTQLYGYRPDVFAERVADELSATAFYFKQNDTQALMLSINVCLIQTELAQRILSLLREKMGFAHCMLCATHTHSGPNTAGEVGWGDIDQKYCDAIFIPAILAVAQEARTSAQPVKMGVAHGDSFVGVNRRELTPENKITFGQDPNGCFEPRMTVISFVGDHGKPVANMIHYGAHATAAGKSVEISRDWPGLMVDALETHTGAMTAFFNGPEGDVGPRLSNGKTVGNMDYVRELGAVAAKDAIRIYDKIAGYDTAELSTSAELLLLPLKKRMDLQVAKQRLEEYKDKTTNVTGMMKAHFADVVRSYEEGFAEESGRPMEQTILALGDVVFASFPYELFSELGVKIDAAFDQKAVLSLSNTNGSEGYFVTRDALRLGGYEVDMFLYAHLQPYADHVQAYIVEETIRHIQKLK